MPSTSRSVFDSHASKATGVAFLPLPVAAAEAALAAAASESSAPP